LGLSAIATGYGMYEALKKPYLKKVIVPIKNLPKEFNGFTIAQFCDIHVGPTVKQKYLKTIVDEINKLNADLIAFTGDLVDGSVSYLKKDVEPCKELSAPYGKYFVTGNHEYYSGVLSWIEEVKDLGFNVLINEHKVLEKGNSRIILAGVTDTSGGQFLESHKTDPKAAIDRAPTACVKILLAHQPRSLYKAAEVGYDLQLSGHTHGGQYIPWNYFATIGQPFVKGLHKYKDTWIYVSQGTGYWGPPLRIGTRSEITFIKLITDIKA
jgi:predicted MPP superfamily phosphohydrolase